MSLGITEGTKTYDMILCTLLTTVGIEQDAGTTGYMDIQSKVSSMPDGRTQRNVVGMNDAISNALRRGTRIASISAVNAERERSVKAGR